MNLQLICLLSTLGVLLNLFNGQMQEFKFISNLQQNKCSKPDKYPNKQKFKFISNLHTKVNYSSPNWYRQSRKERSTSTIHIAMTRAVLVDSKKIILGRKERRLQIKDEYKTNHYVVV